MVTATAEIYTYGHILSLHDALPIFLSARVIPGHQLADHSVDRRMILLCFMAPVIGTGGAFGAWLLLKSIAIATNAFWFGRLSAQEVEITDEIGRSSCRERVCQYV